MFRGGTVQAVGIACAKAPQTQVRPLDFIPVREETIEGFEQMSKNYSDSMVGKTWGCTIKGVYLPSLHLVPHIIHIPIRPQV